MLHSILTGWGAWVGLPGDAHVRIRPSGRQGIVYTHIVVIMHHTQNVFELNGRRLQQCSCLRCQLEADGMLGGAEAAVGHRRHVGGRDEASGQASCRLHLVSRHAQLWHALR